MWKETQGENNNYLLKRTRSTGNENATHFQQKGYKEKEKKIKSKKKLQKNKRKKKGEQGKPINLPTIN